ncbi:hypothetical protein ACJU26_03740 [Acidithiobacillus sp. M4-SHS-6]|uniref:hypothetical protein n=1 Tax=Acidithiobacillus sp. M4-SHS-6 TaxID=3383024 RepID=UPI0039BDECC0
MALLTAPTMLCTMLQRKLNEAENLRMIADYHGSQTSQVVAKQLVGTADAFAKEVEKRVTKTLGIGL